MLALGIHIFFNLFQLHVLKVQLGGKRKAADKALVAFLEKNSLAKIVIVVDTHTDQEGRFITKTSANFVESDVLGPVRGKAPKIIA